MSTDDASDQREGAAFMRCDATGIASDHEWGPTFDTLSDDGSVRR